MTTLYRPVLIESAEQAEAMPPGTVALRSWGDGTTARTLTNGRWITPSGGAMPHVETVGFTALVPIEAEEEPTEDVVQAAVAAILALTNESEETAHMDDIDVAWDHARAALSADREARQ